MKLERKIWMILLVIIVTVLYFYYNVKTNNVIVEQEVVEVIKESIHNSNICEACNKNIEEEVMKLKSEMENRSIKEFLYKIRIIVIVWYTGRYYSIIRDMNDA